MFNCLGMNQECFQKNLLTPISLEKQLIINPTNGLMHIVNATDVFGGGVDPEFYRLKIEQTPIPTQTTTIQVYEINKDITLKEGFYSLNRNLENLCFTQHQIIKFCIQFPGWLTINGYSTFFLFKSVDKYLVSYVRRTMKMLNISLLDLTNEHVWCVKHAQRRIIVPSSV